MRGMAYVFEKRLKYVGNDVDLWEMAKIYRKCLKYLIYGLNMWELTQRFWQMAQISYPCRKDEEDARPPPAPKAQRPHRKQIEKEKSEPPSKRTAEGTRRHPYNRWTPV